MKSLAGSVAGLLCGCSLIGATAARGGDVRDMTFCTEYESGRPRTANFYLDGRAIGAGREGFAAIVERIGKLPAGTSVVWGPNYDRCGACSGMEPRCVPKFLYPDLWRKLEADVDGHRLILSCDFPGPWPMSVGQEGHEPLPAALSPGDAAAKQRFAAVIDWEVIENKAGRDDDPNRPFIDRGRFRHRLSAAGKELGKYDLDLLLGRLPEEARVLVRLAAGGRAADGDVADMIRWSWELRIGEGKRHGKLAVVLTAPPKLAEALRRAAGPGRLRIDWDNFRGPGTPHEEVLYRANDRFVGRGDEGFARILEEVDRLPPGATVVLTRYELSGRAAMENFSDEEIKARNAKLLGLVPFATRRREFEAVIARRKLVVEPSEEDPGEEPGTVLDWHSGDRRGSAFVSFGRIVRHDERRGPAAVRLGWARYEAGNQGEDRRAESTAAYMIDDVEVGRGVAGFARAMARLAALPEGSVVQVRCCLRTKGPFLCPLTYEGHRHFERTGFEPYFGMFPWLLDVARGRKLDVQWLPDEGESCGDCELNR